MALENKGQQFDRGFQGQGQQPARQYNLSTRPKKPEVKKETFPQQKYGNYITNQKLAEVIKDLKREEYRNPKEKWNIEKKIKTLKEALGEK